MKTSRRQFYQTAGEYEYDLLKSNANVGRRHPTQAESVFWERVRNKRLGQRFRRQHIIGEYIADFVCLPLRLIVEIDGPYHADGEARAHDEHRTQYLTRLGYKVIRFTNDQVICNTDQVISTLQTIMQQQDNYSNTPSSAEGSFSGQGSSCPDSVPSNTTSPLLGRGRGRLLIFCAPSGTGKSTLIQYLMQQGLNLHFSISTTTRAPRGTEKNGVEYFFITPDEFRRHILNGDFVEFEEVYTDKYYGTLKSQVDTQLDEGQNIVFDVDVNGGMRIKQHYGEQALALFIMPPSIETLRQRLEARGTDAPDIIDQRIARAEYEISQAPHFDRQIVNDDLETAKREVLEAVRQFLR